MDLDKETQEKIQQLQAFEQSLHSLLMQKQAFQMELSETENALAEINKTNEVYKLVGKILIKSDKNSIEKDLKKKQELISIRLKSIDKQEDELSKQSEELREDVMKRIG